MRSLNVMPMLVFSLCLGCTPSESPPPKVTRQNVDVPVDSSGLTAEQRNIKERLFEDNKPGSVKHLYVISAYSGQVIIYSTVRGKVTSAGKRLTPTTVAAYGGGHFHQAGAEVTIGDRQYETAEVLQDDGTYGHSSEYLYWWDTKSV